MPAESVSSNVALTIGDVARSAAAEVCRRRGWRQVYARNLAEAHSAIVSEAPAAALVIGGMISQTCDALVHFSGAVARDAPDLCLGFLYGRDEAQLLEAAQRLPVTPSSGGESGRQLALAFPEYAHYVRGARVAHAKSLTGTPAERGDLIQEPVDVLYLIGHSNGHDAGVEGIVLCRRPTVADLQGDALAYPCYHGAECRFADAGYSLQSADTVKARAVVSLTCWGVSLADYPFSVELSVGEGLLRYARVQTLIAPARAITVPIEDYLGFYYFLNEGWPMGVATNRVNQLRLRRGQRADYLCFGDPQNHLDRTVLDMTVGRQDGVFLGCPAAGPERDFVIPLPEDSRQPGVLLLENGAPVSAALVTPKSLYITVPEREQPADVGFRLVDPAFLSEQMRALQQMRSDLSYFDRFVRGIGKTIGETAPDSFLRAKFALAVLKELFDGWPTRPAEPGAVVTVKEIEASRQLLTSHLGLLAEAYLDLCVDLGHVGDKYVMTAASQYYRWNRSSANVRPCRYCGRPVDEEVFHLLWRESERRMGACEACGPIYEGDPSVALWIGHSQPFRIGAVNSITVEIRNPFPIEVPIASAFSVGGFHRHPEAIARCESVCVMPGAGRELVGQIQLPSSLKPGVWCLGATVIAGTSVNHLKRPIVLC